VSSSARPTPDAASIVAATARFSDRLGRSDLAARLRAAGTRLANPSNVIAVVGEFKQGKSQLINALIGRDICPVDDDLATVAVTWVYHRPEIQARVRQRSGEEPEIQEIDLDEIADLVAEQGNPENVKGVDLVEVGIPNPVLERGLTLVDTPGAGGLRAGNAAAVNWFLPYADALLFVTDASAPLSACELEFLNASHQTCPNVVVVLSKVDLYPEWRRIQAIDEDLLEDAGLRGRVVPVSAQLRRTAVSKPDPNLNRESGVPDLMAVLRSEILDRAVTAGARRALGEAGETLDHLLAETQTRRQALTEPETGHRLLEQLDAARSRIEDLRKANSKWQTMLSDGIADLNQELDYHLKSQVQTLHTRVDEDVAAGDPANEWETLTARLQTEAVNLAGELFELVDTRFEHLADGIAQLLSDDGLHPPSFTAEGDFSPDELWETKDQSPAKGKAALLASALSALRGTSSGVMLLGVVARLAGLALATPVSIGVGLAFGIKQVLDERKRAIEKRRQEARTILRGFLNRTQMELGSRTRQIVREGHRALRDSFAQRIDELNTTVTSTAQSLRRELEQHENQRRNLLPELEESINQLNTLASQVRGALRQTGDGT
jgi:predicted GTPase